MPAAQVNPGQRRALSTADVVSLECTVKLKLVSAMFGLVLSLVLLSGLAFFLLLFTELATIA